ncbi:hypothetical protein E1B28_007886 [Marasmius oreades]|uniref:Uncharacterized protein n=1 Tax=Marasmius oreades TaxID=181124 RepID=A0A9P7S383_9AGAR|nr:uncharacterized protein E1B28_007886 [Marasmius oreades]KAG7094282.1 hypothetical protein E1B28_007886 [Marasmius oreades]
MGGTISLFTFTTVLVVIEAWGLSSRTIAEFKSATTTDHSPVIDYLVADSKSGSWNSATAFFTTFMNAIADSMLVHRCYSVWNSNKYVLYPLAFIAFILNGLLCFIGSLNL